MAVTQESDSKSKKSIKEFSFYEARSFNQQLNAKTEVEEPTRHCGGEGADPDPCVLTQQKKSNGPSNTSNFIRKNVCGTVRSHELGRISTKKLSDIDDIEVVGYLNTKEEIGRKRILWEAMNEKYIKVKKQKQAAERKKVTSVKKATKTTQKLEPQRRSSRINYDALKHLGGDLESCELTQTSGSGTYAQGTQSSPHGKISDMMHGSDDIWSDEDQDEDQHNIGYEDETHCQYGDEDFYDDF